MRYYTIRDDIPKNIAIDKDFDGLTAMQDWLSEKRGSKVYVTVPQRGEQAQLMAMCRSNAAEELAQRKGATVKEYSVLEELKDLLGLEKYRNTLKATIFQTLPVQKMLRV